MKISCAGQQSDPSMLLSYDFSYPEELIADLPATPRDSSRLLVLQRNSGRLTHTVFRELPNFLRPGDCLVLNESKVRPARLCGHKPTGGHVELLLLREPEPGLWIALSQGLRIGQSVLLPESVQARAEACDPAGRWRLRFSILDIRSYLTRHGRAPLPPYIYKRRNRSTLDPNLDLERYQTVYAKEEGSIAAPTAGLHFTQNLLEQLQRYGVRVTAITLHVGPGTFFPIRTPDIEAHSMLPEEFSISEEAWRSLQETRRNGGRIIAVGTTVVRALETAARNSNLRQGVSQLFIRPGHEFQWVDCLITNFHLPKSTPLVLACAFADREKIFSAYEEAIDLGYRLFSYGDAMLIL